MKSQHDAKIGLAYTTRDFCAISDAELPDCISRIAFLSDGMPEDMLPQFQAEARRRGLVPVLVSTVDKLTVTMPNGDTASRDANMTYKAALVGYDAAGKLLILSSHYSKADCRKALARHAAGRHVNPRYKLLAPGNEPITVHA